MNAPDYAPAPEPSDRMSERRPCWYFTTSFYCPQCGRTKNYRERRYNDRPDNWNDRHEIIETWDYCDAL